MRLRFFFTFLIDFLIILLFAALCKLATISTDRIILLSNSSTKTFSNRGSIISLFIHSSSDRAITDVLFNVLNIPGL